MISFLLGILTGCLSISLYLLLCALFGGDK